jgi:antitoxin ParD1/3/4
MARVEKRTVSLRQEQAALIDDCVASGAYASASEVVRAGLRALEERDTAVSRWLRDEVATVYDAMPADPDCAIPLDDVMTDLAARHAGRAKRAIAANRQIGPGSQTLRPYPDSAHRFRLGVLSFARPWILVRRGRRTKPTVVGRSFFL